MTRKRFNSRAICNSENYIASKHGHINMLQENHQHFNQMVINGEISFDTPIFENGHQSSAFKTIRVFGKEMVVTIDEYNIHCAPLGL